MSDPRDLPALGGLPPELAPLQGFLDAAREHIQLREPTATSVGDQLDKFVTRGELVASGLTFLGGSFGGVVDPGDGTDTTPGGDGDGDYVPDLTPPPTPTGLAVTAGISFIIVECDEQFYTQGHGHDRTVVYGAKWPTTDPTPPTFSEAVVLFEYQGTVGSYPSDPATRWCIWIKWQSIDGVQSVDPAGGINGVQATTGQDVAALLEALIGSITSSQLDSSLLDTINLITDNDTVPGSVAQRIAEVQEQVNTLLEAPDYDNATAYVIGDVVKYLGGLYRAIASTTGNLPTNATYWQKIGDYDSLAGVVAAHGVTLDEHDVRIEDTEDGIVAEAASRTALATQVRGSYTGTDLNALSTGLIYSERVARSTADSSIVSSVTALSATVSSNAASANAAILAEQTARAAADSAEVTARQALSASLTGLTNPASATLGSLSAGLIYDERTARVAADGALSTQVNSVSARLNTGGDVFAAIASVTTTAGVKSANFVQGTPPTATRVNDLWIDTANGNVLKRWNGTAWVLADDVRVGATASQLTTLQSFVDSGAAEQLEAFTTWDFSLNSEGWAAQNSVLTTPQLGLVRIAASTSNPNFLSPAGLSIAGGTYDKVRARVRRIAGVGWDGTLFYVTPAHATSGSYSKTIADPGLEPGGDWKVLEWDMADLTAGGDDWVTSTITRLRIDLGGSAADVFDVDWVAVGKRGSGVSVASFQQEIVTRAEQTGALFAQYTVKLDLNGYVSGFGLASEAPVDGTPSSAFGVRADRFYIGAPGQPDIIPFVVQVTPTTINGVTVPAGVYMDAAYILRGTITGAQIGNATIDNAKIVNLAATKLTAGEISVGVNIDSTGYVAGVSGWRISGNGFAEFSNAVIRNATYTGAIYANLGTIGGIAIDATGIESTNYVAGNAGWRLYSDGSAEFGAASIRGRITADQIATSGDGNAFPDFDFDQPGYASGNITLVNTSNVNLGARFINIGPSAAGQTLFTPWFPVEPNTQYRISGSAFMASASAGSGTANLRIELGSVTGSTVTGLGVQTLVDTSTDSTATAQGAIDYTTGPTEKRMRFLMNRPGNTGGAAARFGGFRVFKKYGTVLIEDESITAGKLVTDQAVITGTAQIANAIITTAKIGDLQVDTAKLANNAVSVTNSVSGSASTISTTLSVPDGQTMRITAICTIPGQVSGVDVTLRLTIGTNSVEGTSYRVLVSQSSSGSGTVSLYARMPLTLQHQRDIVGPATVTVSAYTEDDPEPGSPGFPGGPIALTKRLVALGFLK